MCFYLKDKKPIMGNLIVKDHAFIEASYTLDTVEQRLIFLAILEARKLGDNIESVLNKTLTIHAQSYMQQFAVAKHTAYEALKRGVNGLFEAEFNYTQFVEGSQKIEFVRSRFVQKISYVDDLGLVKLVFANDVVPLIVGLEKKFTKYEIEQIKGLQSRYAIRLYEFLIKWRSVGKTNEISLDKLRNHFGLLNDEYVRMHHFKARVLDLAISQINEHTDITAEYEQHKQGRTITGFTFKFKQKAKPKTVKVDKAERDPHTLDIFVPMTDNQRFAFAKKISQLHEASHLARGQANRSYEAFSEQIAQDLLNNDKQKEYLPFLDQLGFKY